MKKDFDQAHRFSSLHRKELEKDKVCGCFYCLKIFSPSEIHEWCDDGRTALCPYCGIDSVIGESSGYSVTEEFLEGMHKVWF
ncbi:cytoplasmic protein [Sutcliffiella deserti]|uniref:cytoplasmic protein n=1 Tax=Sutcliffiella deserti TaxID=2875501 RepID=UPI001CC03978|nr:cytoplasmic protein [Sutcliffiella deserti]